MPHSTLAPVFTGLRLGLHALLVGLTAFAVVRAFAVSSPVATWTLVVGVAFLTVYLVGARAARTAGGGRVRRRGPVLVWVGGLTVLLGVLVWLSPEGAYLIFPMFFLYLHLLPGAGGVGAVVIATTFAICALGLHLGFSVGGVIGPLVGAAVALLIGLTYRALTREAAEREQLLAELIRTRHRLADTEREQGALAERARLARDLHDTVAQGLASIQMLLRAAERDGPGAGADYVRLARETAADNLADTRQIIGQLTPSRLDAGLPAALHRLGDDQSRRAGVTVEVTAADLALSMDVQTALLRIAQGALANAVRHANATRIGVHLLAGQSGSVSLVVSDDGVGFDVAATQSHSSRTDSFGLQAMRERLHQLGGSLEVWSAPGRGTTITARLDPDTDHEGARP